MWRLGVALLIAGGIAGAVSLVVRIAIGHEPDALSLLYFTGRSILSWVTAMVTCALAIYLPAAAIAALVPRGADVVMGIGGVAALLASLPVSMWIISRATLDHELAPFWMRLLFVGTVGLIIALTVRDFMREENSGEAPALT